MSHQGCLDLMVLLTLTRISSIIHCPYALIDHYPRHHHQFQPCPPFQSHDPKLTKYDGKVPWRAYEVKLDHMAHKYNWDNATKLAKLVEALEDKALTFYSSLPEATWESYSLVKAKFNA